MAINLLFDERLSGRETRTPKSVLTLNFSGKSTRVNRLDNFTSKMHALLGSHLLEQAKNRINKEIEYYEGKEIPPMLLAEIAGFMIDVGNESYNLELVETGIKILEDSKERFKGILTENSYYYCLGNGKHAQYRIKNTPPRLPGLEDIRPHLTEAKNCYYKAYKFTDLGNLQNIDLQVITNLANNLSQAGRIVEAIKLYETVLKESPQFPQSLVGLAENLNFWLRVSGSAKTKTLLSIIYKYYSDGLNIGNIPPNVLPHMLTNFKKFQSIVSDLEISDEDIFEELKEAQNEYDNHSEFVKFCLNNFLSLNEHAIYCKCKVAVPDNLSIGREGIYLHSNKIPKMELLLNRIKSEFLLARKLFYEGNMNAPTNDISNFNELKDDEEIGENPEKMRTSFKSCFGILDKIAHGVCYFYDLKSNPKENIYFESFWKSSKNANRWEKIKNYRNPHLVALYSIATDLSNTGGEFSHYKEWRNKLEHGLLILKKELTLDIDPLKLFNDKDFANEIPFNYFGEQLLHLLQLCRAAIFSFTYCVRMESIAKPPDKEVNSFLIRQKK